MFFDKFFIKRKDRFPTKRMAQKILELAEHMKDFIPGGKRVNVLDLKFRKTKENDPAYFCCQETGEDLQSGPYFCGKIADFVSSSDDSYVGLCESHKPPASCIVV